MICSICNGKVERRETAKVACRDCKCIFHCACVNIRERDLEFMNNGNDYRCDKCKILRRKSLLIPSADTTKLQHSNATNSTLKMHSTSSSNNKDLRQQPSNMKTNEATVESLPLTTGNITNIINTENNSRESEELTLQMIYLKLVNIEVINNEFLKTIKSLQEENIMLKNKVNGLESKLNWIQQKQKRNHIEIVGVPDVNDTNARQAAQKIFSDALSVNVDNTQIERCYVKKLKTKTRLNNSNETINKDIICVQFTTYDVKQIIMKKRKQNKNLTTKLFGNVNNIERNIYINESFTKYTQALFMQAKKLKREKKYKYLWFKDSIIYMKKVEGSSVVVVRSFDDLNTI